MGHIHWTADYRRRRRILLAGVTPDTRCRRCGKTIDQHKPHHNGQPAYRSEEHTSELQSLMRISYAVFCLKKKTPKNTTLHRTKSNNRPTTSIHHTIEKQP